MKSSDLILELARPADATAIATMSRDLIEFGLSWRWTPQRVAASIRAPEVNVLVARIHQQTAGFAIMRYGEHVAHLDLLGVGLQYRRLGVGRQLIEWLEKCALIAGIIRVVLEVRAQNEGAQLFYKRLGYRPLVHLPGYYQGVEAAVRMGRDLRASQRDE
jgi:ribosomal-protein-alanine N-acetyltransferase